MGKFQAKSRLRNDNEQEIPVGYKMPEMNGESEAFGRARTLNRSIRAESKIELASDETHKSLMRSKWQSIGALTDRNGTNTSGQTMVNFSRLKKSYATMRKSFRVQLVDTKQRYNDIIDPPTNERYKTKSSNLIGQIGSGAVKLLRGVYSKSQQSGNMNQFQLDSIAQSTNGSFKVLTSHYGETASKKSNVDQEIELRLKRSKRRVLPSAQYQAPDCEHACDDLDLDELEAIKRDNLRLTLRSLKATEPKVSPPDDGHDVDRFAHEESKGVCICKNIEEAEGDETTQQLYCSCQSIASQSSVESDDDVSQDCNESTGDLYRSVAANEDSVQERVEKEPTSKRRKYEDNPRASGGFERVQFEDELRKMFVGLLRENSRSDLGGCATNSDNNNDKISRLLENVCGQQAEESGRGVLSLSPLLPADCVRLSPSEANETESSTFGLIDGSASELRRRKSQSEAAVELKSARNCCKLGGANLSSASQLQQATGERAGKPPLDQQERPDSSLCRTTGGDHGRSEELNNSACAKDETNNTLTCCDSDDVAVVRANSVAAKFDHNDSQAEATCSLLESEHDVVDYVVSEMIRTLSKASSRKDPKKDMQKPRAPSSYKQPTSRVSSTMQLGRKEKYQLATSRAIDQQEEHLYASIHCSAPSPSPERYLANHEHYLNYMYLADERPLYEQSARWRQQFNQETMMSLSRQDLFERQLNNNLTLEPNSKDPTKKRSIFGRIKQLIVPAASNNKANINEERQSSVPMRSLWDYDDEHIMARSKLSPRHKSATLSSKTTQNLLTSSMHHLSASRKSVNHVVTGAYDGEDSPSTMRKSFINGFLTLGRRNKHSLNKHQSVSQIFNTKQRNFSGSMSRGKRRAFGSADSLHSADSGLSCSNLQNLSSSDENNYMAVRASDNLYSKGPESGDRVDQTCEANLQFAVVGKAVAKVDCNPCAYDKEALVFKKGDIIDILERSQSGSWIGQCNGQIGHFKFINVTEIPTNLSENNESSDGDDDDDYEKEIETDNDNNNNEKKGGAFITKLVIRSNTNNETPLPSTRNKVNDRECSLAESKRRSLSMDTIDPSTAQLTTRCLRELSDRPLPSELAGGVGAGSRDNCLSNSNETIMSSLEQLLFAIGLADERVTATGGRDSSATARRATSPTTIADNNQQKLALGRGDRNGGQQAEGKGERMAENKEQQQIAHLSYLDVLNEHGISSLDSFSAVDDWHELEQIGIIDDEHQRRLLMAARIIRQAFQAAKLDFVQNYHAKQLDQSAAMREVATGGEHDKRIDLNPIIPSTTVNTTSEIISDSVRSLPPVVVTKAKGEGAQSEPVYVNLTSARTESIYPEELPDSRVAVSRSKKHKLRARDRKLQADGNITGQFDRLRQQHSSPVRNKQVINFPSESDPNSTSQSDHHYAPRPRPSLSQRHRQSLAAAYGSGHRQRDHEQSRLKRGYSIRPDIGSSRAQQFTGRTDNLSYGGTHQGLLDSGFQVRNSSSNFGGMVATVIGQQTNRAAGYHHHHHHMTRGTVYSSNLKHAPAPMVSSFQGSQMMSVMNSKSAYDLRFDLSHFFN